MPNKAWTVSFWANPEELTNATSLLFAIKDEATGGLNIADQWFNTAFPSVRFWNTSVANYVNAPDDTNNKVNQWTYITLTNDENGLMTLYSDGEKVSSGYAWKTNAVAGDTIMLGINWWDHSYKGLMDEVTIYDRALSVADVDALYKRDGIPNLPATEVESSQETASLLVDGTLKLTATLEPFYSTDVVEWTSSDSETVSVDKDGKLTAKKVGTATITATAGKASSTCEVTVTDKAVPITELSISSNKSMLGVEGTANITLKYKPDDATNVSDVKYTSTNPNVLEVSSQGVVTAKGKGKAKVYASIGNVKSNEVEFEVYEASAVTSGLWNGTHLCSVDFLASGQAVQYDIVCTDMSKDDTDTDVAFFVIEANKGNKYISMSSYNDAWGDGATGYSCSRTDADYSTLISAGDSITVTVNRVGDEIEAIFYNNTKQNEFQRITATVNADMMAGGSIYFYPQYGTYYVNAVSHSLTKDDDACVAAKCTENGKEVYKCTADDYVYDKTLAATGHNPTKHDGTPATCTTPGTKEYWTCANEGDVRYEDEACTTTITELTIDALGHNMEKKEEKAATCEDDGNKEYWECTNESGVYYKNEDRTGTYNLTDIVIPARHDLGSKVEATVTCTEAGNVEHYKCTVCNKYFEDPEAKIVLDTIASEKLGHTYGAPVVTKATPNADGKITKTCSRCGDVETVEVIKKPIGITLDKESYEYAGKAIEPAVTVKDIDGKIDAANYNVKYSDNTKVGTAMVTVTFKSDSDKYEGKLTKTFEITEKKGGTGGNTPTASLKLNKDKATLYTGKASNTITVKVTTVTGTSKTVKWKSSDEKVAKVNQNGKITAVGKGTATITATANRITKKVTVTVKNPTLTIKKGSKKITDKLTVNKNKRVVLKVTVSPKNSGITTVKLKTKEKKIASVSLDKKGTLTIKGKKKGSFKLQIKSGKTTKNIKITVK